jgi:YfiH family protein
MREVPLAPHIDPAVAWLPLGDGEGQRGLRAGLSLRAAGDLCHPKHHAERGDREGAAGSAAARRRFLDCLGVDEARLRYCRQVHSRSVLWLEGGPEEAGRVARIEADGLLTRSRDAVPAVTVADCLPIFLADPRTGTFGVLHSGWKGTGILRSALRLLEAKTGSGAGRVVVTIGPGIGSCCYEVDEERYASFRRRFGPGSVLRSSGRRYLDLQAANLRILQEEGVESITVVRACTACTPELSSYRRDGSGFAHMLAFIGEIPDRSTQ